MPYFVSTHSRPKAAGPMMLFMFMLVLEFQHTAARRRLGRFGRWRWWPRFGFNTQPPEGGWGLILLGFRITTVFQHTAARRRLGNHAVRYSQRFFCFNTQPPEGGWGFAVVALSTFKGFNTQPPEGGWVSELVNVTKDTKFQHTAARRRLGSTRSSS